MTAGSLRVRLVAGGALAILSALALAGAGLTYLFERQVLATLASTLEIDLRQILATVELDADGRPVLRREPSDPRFNEPLSGLYWQLSTQNGKATRSRSLWDAALPLPEDTLAPGESHRHRIAGPANAELLAVERTVVMGGPSGSVTVRAVVAADLSKVAEARRSFSRDLIPYLALLAAALAAATWVQIGMGLRPLQRLRDNVATVRKGGARRILGPAPSEVQPLVEEINALLSAQEDDLERARGRAADLAHGLKTPLSALMADVRALDERGDHELARRIDDIGEAMRRHVERELARVRIRGARGAQEPFNPAALVEKLVSIQRRATEDRALTFDVRLSGQPVSIDQADLAEALGNLIENASRHARRRVRLSEQGGRFTVEDDGPGVSPERRALILRRGARLDETGEGTGLGLAIVQDVLEAYGRKLELSQSDLGGLRVAF